MRSVLSKVTIAFGESQGETRLPLPPVGGSKTDDTGIAVASFRAQQKGGPMVKGKAAEIGEKFGSASTSNERVHLFESAVVTWTKQIKKVLELDAEAAMNERGPDSQVHSLVPHKKILGCLCTQVHSLTVVCFCLSFDPHRYA